MNKPLIKLSVFLLFLHFLLFPKQASAVVPPDFVFNIGSQVAQFFSVIVIFFTAVFGAFFQFFKTKYYAIKHKKTVLAAVIFTIAAISAASTYYFSIIKQKAEYNKWLAESRKDVESQYLISDTDNDGLLDIDEFDFGTDYKNPDTDSDGFLDGEEVKNGYNPKGPGKLETIVADENDKLKIGGENNQNIDTSNEKFVSKIDLTDSSSRFINDYYKNIATGNLKSAYEMSTQSVSYGVFEGWYLETTKITLDNLVRIDDEKSSIELTLYEGDNFTRYGVLMTLALKDTVPEKVEKSEVRILAQGSVENNIVSMDDSNISQEYSFFNENKNKNIIITNQELKDVLNSGKNDYVILDAREALEYEIGQFPGALHIRFADLRAGRWIELPKDKFVYVFCWQGGRGKEVAEYLRNQNIVASSLENGVNGQDGWVAFGGDWIGFINFSDVFFAPNYRLFYYTDQFEKLVKEGAIIVDSRDPNAYNLWHFDGSISIPIMYTPTIDLERTFNQVPPKSRIVIVCDEYTNIFDAKITGIEMERRGYEFLGRYLLPTE